MDRRLIAFTIAAVFSGAALAADQPAEAGFSEADLNSDGYVSMEEAERLDGLAAEFDQLDQDKDGQLTEAEFAAFQPTGESEPAIGGETEKPYDTDDEPAEQLGPPQLEEN